VPVVGLGLCRSVNVTYNKLDLEDAIRKRGVISISHTVYVAPRPVALCQCATALDLRVIPLFTLVDLGPWLGAP
jgi:hypothetical protein